jgi:hypothetical protein
MNRRKALFVSLLGGGLVGSGLCSSHLGAQSPTRKTAAARSSRSTNSDETEAPRRASTRTEPEADEAATPETAPSFATEPGHQWRSFDIASYVNLTHSQNNPQNAIVEWIFRRTGSNPWHGDKIAVLSAGRTRIRAYNNPQILDQVAEVVERFTNATNDTLSVRVRFVAAVDTRWRYAVFSRLVPVGNGPQGQQIWTLKTEDSHFVLNQMQIYQGFKLLHDHSYDMVNGQTLTINTFETRSFTGGIQRENAIGLGFQPRAEQIEEGITLRLSPLLTFDGDTLDAAIELTANTIKSFHRTKVIAPRDVGPAEMTVDVPESVGSRLNQTVKGWPLGQTLLISAGIQPGILQSKGGFLNLRIPGTVPTSTELLIFLDAEATDRPRTARN